MNLNCRGALRRKSIVNEYYVTPIAHVKLLQGQIKYSDADAPITDQYYQFKAVNKNTKRVQTIQCGMGVARDFLKLTQCKPLPLFNPLQQNVANHNIQNGGINGRNNGNKNKISWNPKAKQLYNAIMWIIVIWNGIKVDSPLYNIKEIVEKYATSAPFSSRIKGVNTIIRETIGKDGSTLTDAINKLKDNNDIRNNVCDFSLLIPDLKDKDGKEIESYF